jgi:D-methionine transport system permease protein
MIANVYAIAVDILPIELWHTFYMVAMSAFLAFCLGLPIGIVLALTSQGHLKENRWLYRSLSTIVNIGRSFPFIILMVALIPFTRMVVGTSLGTTAAIVPLTIAATPFIARLIEEALCAVRFDLIEAALVMGSTTWQIVWKLLIPEALPGICLAATTMVIQLIGASAMAGAMGGGGLGKVAIQYGYQRFNAPIMIMTIILLIIFVQLVQWLGTYIASRLLERRGKS